MLVKPTGVLLHLSCLLSHGIDALQADLPKSFALNETAHVLPPDERDVAAELRHIKVNQHSPMVIFLCCHIGKDMCGIGMMFPQSVSEIGVDSAILFLTADCKRENFGLGEVIEGLHDGSLSLELF